MTKWAYADCRYAWADIDVGVHKAPANFDFKYVNLRRRLIFIDASIDRDLQRVVFQPNDDDPIRHRQWPVDLPHRDRTPEPSRVRDHSHCVADGRT